MATDTQHLIGKKLVGGEGRDAVHIAVYPVIAGAFLRKGDSVKFDEGSTEIVVESNGEESDTFGVIDPFLDCYYVAKGERCWMFLRPNTITSLRHVWTHPAIPVEATSTGESALRASSEQWLRGFADRYEGDYERMIAAAQTGGGYCFGRDLEYDDFNVGSEFWHHVSIVTGRVYSPEEVESTSFRCAC